MKVETKLTIESKDFNKSLVDKELQLKPDALNPVWTRFLPESKVDLDLSGQINYWCGLFNYKKEEKNRLINIGYELVITASLSGEFEFKIANEVLVELAKKRIILVLKHAA